MIRAKHCFFMLLFVLASLYGGAQQGHALHLRPVDKDSAFLRTLSGLPDLFANREECLQAVNGLLPVLRVKGFIAASIDSIATDSLATTAWVYAGPRYRWQRINTDAESQKWLSHVGWDATRFEGRLLDYDQVYDVQQRMLRYFENNGYPFAKVYLDSIRIGDESIEGNLYVVPGKLYLVDSIRVVGGAKISNDYLQRYLGIPNGSPYNKAKLQQVSEELQKLNYVEENLPPYFYWGSASGVLELYLKPKKSNQVNFIIGFLPNNQQVNSKKMMITGEALLNLQNALGGGETIGLVWQKLQVSSQQLSIQYKQPYLFRSPFGLDFDFNMFKKDSSFLNYDFKLGGRYALSNQQSAALFVQQSGTVVSAVNTSLVLQNRQLPEDADIRITEFGLEYYFNNTNYIRNPVKGYELNLITAAGKRKINRNNQILELEDPNDPAFDFATLYDTVKLKSTRVKIVLSANKYFPLSVKGRTTLKASLNGGYIGSPKVYRNEMFQIGGYKLLRGFDEQSQYLSQYALGTLEFRYLVGQNAYFNTFLDGGWGKSNLGYVNANHGYVGLGMGMAFETKVGVFKLAWAVGKRDSDKINLRQSKIHFGFVNYF
ncbi:MAG: BamA/TamA family outer membrane protein [Niabella sp.]